MPEEARRKAVYPDAGAYAYVTKVEEPTVSFGV